MKTVLSDKPIHTQARALLAAIGGSPTAYIPRREVLVDWLNAFLLRSRGDDYVFADNEASDVDEVAKFLRTCGVGVASA